MRKAYVVAVLVATGAIMTAARAPQTPPPPAGGPRGGPPPGRGGGGMLAGAGPSDKPVGDPAAANRGRKVWESECIDCDGTQARGGDKGPNLVRSVVVLRRSIRQPDRAFPQEGAHAPERHAEREPDRRAGSGPRTFPAAEGQRRASRIAAVPGPEHPDR